MMKKGLPSLKTMILFRKFTLPFVIVIVATLVGMMFYHNGFSEQCPFCRSGTSEVEKLRVETISIDKENSVIYYPHTELLEIIPFDYVEDSESRAPPV